MSTAKSDVSAMPSLPSAALAPSRPPDHPDPQHARRWLILGVIGIAQLMVILDATIVNIALPSAQQDLGFADANRQWIVTSYALPFGSLLLLGGRLSDLFGRKVAFMSGLAGFAAASALGGAAENFTMLVVARTAQGTFGALLAPAALALLTTTFTDSKERGKAFGIFGAIAGTGAAIGLLLGGVLTEYLSWRWSMFINLIFAGVAFIGAVSLLQRQRSGGTRPALDVPGAVTGSAGLFCIVYGFANASSHSWSSPPVWGYLAGGTVLLAGFVVLQNRVAHPLLPMRVVLDRDRGGAYLAVLLTGVGIFGVFLFLTFYLQQNLGLSPIRTGVAFLPMVAGLMVSATSSTAVLLPRFGPRPLVAIGMSVAASGLFWLSYLQVGSTYAAGVLPQLLVTGFGLGMVMAPSIQTATTGVSPSDAGVASATVNTMQQVGGSVGTALLATIAGNAASDYLTGRAPTPDVLAEAAVHSYTTAFVWGSAIFLAGAVLCGAILRPGAHRPAADDDDVHQPAAHDDDAQPAAALDGAVPGLAAQPTPGPPPEAGAGPQPLVMLGCVRTPESSPLPGAMLTLIDVHGNQIDRAHSAADGSYRLDVPATGSYVLSCAAPPHPPAAKRLTISPETIHHDLVIGLLPTAGRPATSD
jgi:EmrB/QacA subfamily drug resistance transporter